MRSGSSAEKNEKWKRSLKRSSYIDILKAGDDTIAKQLANMYYTVYKVHNKTRHP